MNRLWLSIKRFLMREEKGKIEREPFCFCGYSSAFSVSDYLRRMSELSERLVKERVEVPKPRLTFAPFSSDLSIQTPEKPNALIRAVLREKGETLPEANLTGCQREEWERRILLDCRCCTQSAISSLRSSIEEQRFSAAQSAQNQILSGILEQNQRIKTGFDSISLPIAVAMMGIQASDCLRKPCETPYSNIPRGLFG